MRMKQLFGRIFCSVLGLSMVWAFVHYTFPQDSDKSQKYAVLVGDSDYGGSLSTEELIFRKLEQGKIVLTKLNVLIQSLSGSTTIDIDDLQLEVTTMRTLDRQIQTLKATNPIPIDANARLSELHDEIKSIPPESVVPLATQELQPGIQRPSVATETATFQRLHARAIPTQVHESTRKY